MNTIEQFMALPLDVRNVFHNVASKSNEFRNGFEWFASEIPASVADNVDAIRVLLDGGTATVSRVVGDRGVGGGGYTETETIEFPDRDFSRHTSGHNGGEYTPDNVTLESDNMTTDEIDIAQNALETDASLLADADIITPMGDAVTVAESGTSVLGEIGDAVLDGLLPATIGLAMGKHVADQFDDNIDKIGYGSIATGTTVLLCLTPIGQFGLACYAAHNVFKLGKRGVKWFNEQPVS